MHRKPSTCTPCMNINGKEKAKATADTYQVQEVNGSDSLGIPVELAQDDQFHAQDFRHRTAALTFPHKIQCDGYCLQS